MAAIVVDRGRLPKVGWFFVQRVVRQVHEHVLHCVFGRIKIQRLVLLGRESDEAFTVHEYFQGVTWSHKDVDSHIKFKAVYQIRGINVLLNDGGLILTDVVDVVCYEDTFALRQLVWFWDHCEAYSFVFALFGYLFLAVPQIIDLLGQYPGFREKCKLWGK